MECPIWQRKTKQNFTLRFCRMAVLTSLIDVSDIFYFFWSGEGKGEYESQGWGGGRFSIENPKGGGLQERGGGQGAGKLSAVIFFLGGGVNFFFRGRNAHQGRLKQRDRRASADRHAILGPDLGATMLLKGIDMVSSCLGSPKPLETRGKCRGIRQLVLGGQQTWSMRGPMQVPIAMAIMSWCMRLEVVGR